MSIEEARTRLRDGTVTPSELVEQCLARIDQFDDRVKAWVLVDRDGARRVAKCATTEIRVGKVRGPLHGIPVGIKDIIDVATWPTRAGSPLRESHVATDDAPLVASLKAAGAILLGKTVTVEFACFDPSPTRNPWDPELRRSPGGSSSGSAAAVAMGMCLAAIGTQTGGSLVRPASYCGIATCKPTFGRVSTDGVVPVSHHLDHPGPMARTVGDLDILLRHLPRGNDFGQAKGREADCLTLDRPPRMGVVESYFMQHADRFVLPVVRQSLGTLQSRGASVEIAAVPEGVCFEAIQDVHTRVMAADAAAYHRRDFPARRDAYGPMISGLLDQGMAMSAVAYAEALEDLRRYRQRVPAMLDGFDALIMPATDTTAPPTCATTGSKTFQAPWSCSGLPVVSLPCGLAEDGFPVAVQLVGPYHEDARLLQIARWCEEVFEFRAQPPLLDE